MNPKLKWKQENGDENLAGCLASLALFYNYNIPFFKITQVFSGNEDKKSLVQTPSKFEQIGFKAKVTSTDWNIKTILWPLMAWYANEGEEERFVVIYKKGLHSVTIMDPLSGNFEKIKSADFEKNYKGLLVTIIPVDTIEKYKKASNFQRFVFLLKAHKSKLVQSLIGTLAEIILELTAIVYILKIVDYVLIDGNANLLNLMSLAMIVFLFLRIVLNVCRKILVLKVETNIDGWLTLAYYKQLIALPKNFYQANKNGDLTSRIYDVNEISQFITVIVQKMILNILFIAFSLVFMLAYSWKLTLAVFISLFLYYCLYVFYRKTSELYFRKYKINYSDFYAHFTETLSSVDTIKNFSAGKFFSNIAESKYVLFLKTKYKTSIINIILENSTELISGLAIILIMWFGALMVISHDLTPGALISFYVLLGYLFVPAKNLVYSNYSAQLAIIASDRLFEIMEISTENDVQSGIVLPKGFKGDIRLNNISFHYGSGKKLFKEISLNFPVNKTTAIVGESGSGKTSLVSLIQNLFSPDEGSIYFGDYNLTNIDLASLRNHIGIVPQKVDLFAGTITENIALGQLNPDMRRIADLCNLIGISKFIENLKNGYNTQVGEQGTLLSGGERQRIAIVRALYKDPEVLILDEATSALDSGSEIYVKNAIRLLRQNGKTIILIAHRLSTIMEADNIVVLKNGEIAEEGTHSQLMNIKQHYYRMWTYQYPRIDQGDIDILGKNFRSLAILNKAKEITHNLK